MNSQLEIKIKIPWLTKYPDLATIAAFGPGFEPELLKESSMTRTSV
jgi:L-ribulose-5-phosphate 3-epimerase UlaE